MQLRLLSIFLTLCITQAAIAKLEKDPLLQAITSAHTRAFSKDNLIVSRQTHQELKAWYEALEGTQQFVKKHAPDLLPAFNTLNSMSNTLINTLKASFGVAAMAFNNTDDKKEGLSSFNPSKLNLAVINVANLNALIKPLEQLKTNLIQMQDSLTATLKRFRQSTFTSKQKGNAAEVLIRLAITLEATIAKAIKDTQKINSAVEQK